MRSWVECGLRRVVALLALTDSEVRRLASEVPNVPTFLFLRLVGTGVGFAAAFTLIRAEQ